MPKQYAAEPAELAVEGSSSPEQAGGAGAARWLRRARGRLSSCPRQVVIVNPHGLGDAVITLPLAGRIRRRWPQTRIHFAGKPELQGLVDACEFFDGFIDSRTIAQDPRLLTELGTDIFLNPFPDDDLARAAFAARVPVRVGNLLRRTALYCNRFVAYNSTLGAHVLSFYLHHLKPLGLGTEWPVSDHVALYGLTRVEPLQPGWRGLIDPARFNLVLHPKSGGSGREWPVRSYLDLAKALARDGRFRLIVSGSAQERQAVLKECPELVSGEYAADQMGKLGLSEFLSLLQAADGVLASSTGPVHVAAALGRHALGIYGAGRGLSPVAWAPVGLRARTVRAEGACKPGVGHCPRIKGPPCPCVMRIDADQVLQELVLPALQDVPDGRAIRPGSRPSGNQPRDCGGSF